MSTAYPITLSLREVGHDKPVIQAHQSSMASIAAESKATISVNNGVVDGVETIPKTHSLPGSRGSFSWLNWKRISEVLVLSCVIIAVWGPFLVPTILYAFPPLQVSYYPQLCIHLMINGSMIVPCLFMPGHDCSVG